MASAIFRIGNSAVSDAGPWTWHAYDAAVMTCAAHDWVKVDLQSTAGVNSIAVTLPTGDDAQLAAGMPAVTVDQATKTATFRLDNAAFRSINIRVVVNNGLDANFATDANLTKQLQVGVPSATGLEALVVGETDERHRTYGYVGKMNAWVAATVAYNAGHVATLYVETTGNDGTAVRGNMGFPYATIAAAIAAAQSGDTIKLGIGTWAETVTLPELAKFSFIGSGLNETIITSAAAGATVSALPAATKIQSLTIQGMQILNTGAGQALYLGGGTLAVPGICITGICELRDLYAYGAAAEGLVIECAGNVIIHECVSNDARLNEVDSSHVYASQLHDMTVDWDGTGTLPVGVGGSHKAYIMGCEISTLLPKGLAQVYVHSEVSTTTATFTESGATHGKLFGRGSLGAVTINADSVAAVDSADLRGAAMSALTVTSGAGASRVSVDARGATVTGTATANNLVDIDIRDGFYGLLAVAGNGTIDRSHWVEVFDAVVGDTTVTFAVPLPAGATYGIAFGMVGAGGDPFFKNRTAAGFDITCAAALGAGNFATITRY